MHRLSAYVIVRRTQSDQTPNAIQSDTERNPIRRRTETVWGAAVSAAPTKNWQSIAAVSAAPTKQTGNLLQLSPLHQPSKLAIYCSCLSSALPLARARTAPTKQ